ncbi:MAG: enoyl-CoA hydratase/isomerase family protein [Spirochaetales bacterium]|nr:enoyl-CoA hydratase/isomerase family protein [Spirochaetales bacterium]
MELNTPVESTEDSGLLIVTLNRGKEGNPLTPHSLSALEAAFRKACADPAIRVILLRSNADTFCTGMDLPLLADNGGDMTALEEAVTSYSSVLNAIYACDKPVICCVSGEVRAGGVGLVCCCDIVCATGDSVFSLSEVIFGLVPANVFPYLLGYRVTPQKARYLALTTRQLTAAEALSLGIVDELADRGKMEQTLKARIRQLMRCSPDALSRVKRVTAGMTWKDLQDARAIAVKTLTDIAADPAVLEAIRAFREGMTPSWFSTHKPSQKLFLEERT